MPTRNTNSKTFLSTFTIDNRRYRKVFKSKLDADAFEIQQRQRHLRGEALDDSVRALSDVAWEVYESKWMDTPNEIGRKAHVKCICSFFGHKNLQEIDNIACNEYVLFLKNTKRNAISTINGKISALTVIFDYALDNNYISTAPRVKGRKKPNNECLEYISEAEEAIILPFMLNHELESMRKYGEFWAWSVDTGFRPSESRRLRPQDVYFDDTGRWMAKLLKSKTNTWRVIPLTDRALEMWQKNRAWAHITPRMISTCWERVRKFRGRENDSSYKAYLTRHTTGSRLVQRNVDLPVIKQVLGHSDLTSTMRYAKVSPTNLFDAIDKLNNNNTQ